MCQPGLMSRRFDGLFTRSEDGGPLEPGKVSELLLDYAAPLFEDGYPPDVESLRAAMRIAVVCWNAAFLEMTGDASFRQMLAPFLANATAEGRAVMQRLLEERKTRFGAIPVLLDVEVEGTDVMHARIVARAYNAPLRTNAASTPSPARPLASGSQPWRGSSAPGAMQPFDTVFFELAKRESRAWMVSYRPGLAAGTYFLREFYCTEAACDCRRVLLEVHHVEGQRIAATINYAFEPPEPPFADEQQVALDLLNSQGEGAEELLRMFVEMVALDRDYHQRLVDHYELWKSVVDDERHPDHAKMRGSTHDDAAHNPAFPRRELSRSHGVKVGANDKCPCGSGRKYKKCCRQ